MSKQKYDDEETRKLGAPIETPYKHNDIRNKLKQELEKESKEKIN